MQSKVSGQTNNHCITISMQKVAQSINSFLKCSINISPIFDYAHRKQLEVIFSCPEFVSTFEKSVYSFYSFFRYNQCWSPVSRVFKPTWPYPTKSFSINFNFHKFNFFWNMLKIRLFHHFVVEIQHILKSFNLIG